MQKWMAGSQSLFTRDVVYAADENNPDEPLLFETQTEAMAFICQHPPGPGFIGVAVPCVILHKEQPTMARPQKDYGLAFMEVAGSA